MITRTMVIDNGTILYDSNSISDSEKRRINKIRKTTEQLNTIYGRDLNKSKFLI